MVFVSCAGDLFKSCLAHAVKLAANGDRNATVG